MGDIPVGRKEKYTVRFFLCMAFSPWFYHYSFLGLVFPFGLPVGCISHRLEVPWGVGGEGEGGGCILFQTEKKSV